MKSFLFVLSFVFLMFYGLDAHAVEQICPGQPNAVAMVIYCNDFTTLDSLGNESSTCCWHTGPGSANDLIPQRGVKTSDPRAIPGGVDAGPCDIPPGNDCGGKHPTVYFQGNQGFASPNAWYSGYYWECCGNYYGDYRLPNSTISPIGKYTELRIRWYVYLNGGWNIPCPNGGTYGGTCGAKNLTLAGVSGTQLQSLGYTMLYATGNGPDCKSRFDVYGATPPDNLEYTNQNQGNDLCLHGNQWYLYEIHVKMNTGGGYNGTAEMWIDPVDPSTPGLPAIQTLRLRRTDIRFTGGGGSVSATAWDTIGLVANANFGYCHPGINNNDGVNGADPCLVVGGQVAMVQPNAYFKVSNLVVAAGPATASTMIGPVGGGTIPTVKVPKPPSTLTLTP